MDIHDHVHFPASWLYSHLGIYQFSHTSEHQPRNQPSGRRKAPSRTPPISLGIHIHICSSLEVHTTYTFSHPSPPSPHFPSRCQWSADRGGGAHLGWECSPSLARPGAAAGSASAVARSIHGAACVVPCPSGVMSNDGGREKLGVRGDPCGNLRVGISILTYIHTYNGTCVQ